MTTDISRFTAQYNGQTVNFGFDDMYNDEILVHGHFGTMKLRNGDEQDLTCVLVQKYQLRDIIGVTADGGRVYPQEEGTEPSPIISGGEVLYLNDIKNPEEEMPF